MAGTGGLNSGGSTGAARSYPSDNPEGDPYSFGRRCRIESAFPQISDAYDLTLQEFADRLAWLEDREAGRANGPLAVLHRQMRQWSRGRR